MIAHNLKLILILYLAIVFVGIIVVYKFKKGFWPLFGGVILPIILTALILYNFGSFSSRNRIYLPSRYQGRLHFLPSNQLMDLFIHSTSPARTYWIYPLIDIYYQGRTLLIPDELIGPLDLTVDELVKEGRLGGVSTTPYVRQLSDDQVDSILALDHQVLQFRNGKIFYFVIDGNDSGTTLYLLTRDNQFFFVPGDFVPDIEGEV